MILNWQSPIKLLPGRFPNLTQKTLKSVTDGLLVAVGLYELKQQAVCGTLYLLSLINVLN